LVHAASQACRVRIAHRSCGSSSLLVRLVDAPGTSSAELTSLQTRHARSTSSLLRDDAAQQRAVANGPHPDWALQRKSVLANCDGAPLLQARVHADRLTAQTSRHSPQHNSRSA